MDFTHEDFQRARRISNAVQKYLEMTNKEGVRSTDIYPYLAKKGIIENDRHNGIHLRRFLNKLKDHNLLKLIPQCTCIPGVKDEFNEWYFYLSKTKNEAKVVEKEDNPDVSLILVPALTDSEIDKIIITEKSNVEQLSKRKDTEFTPQKLEIRVNYPRAYEYWSEREYEIMIRSFKQFKKISKVAELLERQPSVVEKKLMELEIIT